MICICGWYGYCPATGLGTNSVCIDFSEDHLFLQLSGYMYPNMNLLLQGYLSSAPTHVSFVVSLCTLELYYQSHVHQPCLSIQAWVQTLCNYHNVSLYLLVSYILFNTSTDNIL